MERKFAAAVSYDRSDSAPRLLAKGRGREAERLVTLARDAGVEIVEDAALAFFLDAAEVGTLVPESCWQALAIALSFVMSETDTVIRDEQ